MGGGGVGLGSRTSSLGRGPKEPLTERLEARRDEIASAVLARVYAVSDPTEDGSPVYVAGLREAVDEAIRFGLTASTSRPDSIVPIPPALLAQARLAARNNVSLETV